MGYGLRGGKSGVQQRFGLGGGREMRVEIEFVAHTILLRLATGFLGEREQLGWWSSSFLGPHSQAFLAHIYEGQVLPAQYSGVVEAARIVHDDHIGIGRVFHLFRMPEEIENSIQNQILNGIASIPLNQCCSSRESAERTLQELSQQGSINFQIGPIHIGDFEEIGTLDSIRMMAAHYLTAFQSSGQCFPYFSDNR